LDMQGGVSPNRSIYPLNYFANASKHNPNK
jgi:hypothetical protein